MGELLIDFVSTQNNCSLKKAEAFVKAPGGAPANVAVALKKLGIPSGFIGQVGDDPFGEYLRECLEEVGVDCEFLKIDPQTRTTNVFVSVWDDGRKDLCFYRNPGADMMLTPDKIEPSIFKNTRGFHFGSIGFINEPLASAQKKAIALAKEHQLFISYDPNYRPTLWDSPSRAHQIIQEAFSHCHLAKVSEEEWELVTNYSDFDSGIPTIMEKGVELLVISRGENGAIATNGEYRIEIPGLDIEVVETTGAGDGFMAAMITKLLPLREKVGNLGKIEPEIVEDALRFANATGALTCTKLGAIPALPTKESVDNFMNRAPAAKAG